MRPWQILVLVLSLSVLGAAPAGAALEAPDGGAAADGGASVDPSMGRIALANQLSPWFATLIGAVGSAAYLVALWVKLVGSKDGKSSAVLTGFSDLWPVKIPLYLASGGAVAMVFQLPESKLVAVQAFIIGCTWPAVVANYLSGRQSGDAAAPVVATAADLGAADAISSSLSPPGSPGPAAPGAPASDQAKRTLDELISKASPPPPGKPTP